MHSESPSNFESSDVEQETSELQIATDRCRNFLKQETPLSEEGKKMEVLVSAALDEDSSDRIAAIAEDLPTVEDAKLKLFEPFHLDKEKRELAFGHQNLASVHITEGCTHQCEMCDNPDPLTMMDGVNVAQIGQEIKEAEVPVEQAWQNWTQDIERLSGVNLNEVNVTLIRDLENTDNLEKLQHLIDVIQQTFTAHPISKYFEQPDQVPRITIDPSNPHEAMKLLNIFYPFVFHRYARELYPVYQGDPFDWRSKTLRHKDGEPADFGDAFKMLSHPLRPIFISTAGYPENDPLGPVASKKIVEAVRENAYLLKGHPRISISPTDQLARKDLGRYRDHMIKVIDDMCELPLNIVFRYEQNGSQLQKDFEEMVRTPIIAHVDELRLGLEERMRKDYYGVQTGGISHWPQNPEDTDSGACIGGIHISTNLEVFRQAGSHKSRPEKGSRPKPIGLNLY